MAHPNFVAPAPDPNPLSSLLSRMARKATEIEETPSALTDEQLDRVRRGALSLAQTAGRELASRRGAR